MPTITIERMLPRAAKTSKRAISNFSAKFGIDARRVRSIVIPPLPPRPVFFRPEVPSGLSADNVAMRLGLVRKIDRVTGKMHFEKRQIRDLRSDARTKKMAQKKKALEDWADSL